MRSAGSIIVSCRTLVAVSTMTSSWDCARTTRARPLQTRNALPVTAVRNSISDLLVVRACLMGPDLGADAERADSRFASAHLTTPIPRQQRYS